MIALLRGKVARKTLTHAVIDVGGLGYKVFATVSTLGKLPSDAHADVLLWTHLAVRENALDLYGFLDEETLQFFEMLIGVSGIGPKSALGILSIADVKTIKRGVIAGDSTYLTKVSGIGKKNAEKIIIELRDKLGALPDEVSPSALQDDTDVLEALISLGYGIENARDAVKKIPERVSGTRERLREALKQIGS